MQWCCTNRGQLCGVQLIKCALLLPVLQWLQEIPSQGSGRQEPLNLEWSVLLLPRSLIDSGYLPRGQACPLPGISRAIRDIGRIKVVRVLCPKFPIAVLASLRTSPLFLVRTGTCFNVSFIRAC